MNFQKVIKWALRKNIKPTEQLKAPAKKTVKTWPREYRIDGSQDFVDSNLDRILDAFFGLPDLRTDESLYAKSWLAHKGRKSTFVGRPGEDVTLFIASGPYVGKYCALEVYFSGDRFTNSWLYTGIKAESPEELMLIGLRSQDKVSFTSFALAPSKKYLDKIWDVRMAIEARLIQDGIDYKRSSANAIIAKIQACQASSQKER